MTSSYIRESEVPKQFNISYDENKVPQRELRDFTVTRGGEKVSICTLDEGAQRDPPMIVRGTVTSKSNKSIRVESAPLIEWCIEYSVNLDPTLWIRTQHVWYKLKRSSKEYARTHELARRRYELCSRIYILLTTLDPSQCTFRKMAPLLAQNYMDMKSYSEREIMMEKDFILSQFEMLCDPVINGSRFVKDLKAMNGVIPKKAAGSGSVSGSESGSRSGSGSGSGSGSPLGRSSRKRGSTGRSGLSSSDNLDNGPSSCNSPAIPPAGGSERGQDEWEGSSIELNAEAQGRVMKKVEKALAAVMKNRLAGPFNQPVDPVEDGCPDYLERISQPMDYGTIKKRLESRKFYNSAAPVVRDVRQVTLNCNEYNTEEHSFSKWALTLQQKFEAAVRAAEEAETSASRKRQASTNANGEGGTSKKRKLSASNETHTKSGPGKRGLKTGKKGTGVSKDKSPVIIPPTAPVEEEKLTPERGLCARSTSKACDRTAAVDSKYCSVECGMTVARERIEELKKKGQNPDAYVRSFITKTMVHSRS